MDDWVDPPWNAPLDADAVLRAVPPDATITGIFVSAVVSVASARGVTLASARPRYTAFQAYPLREHCQLLLEVSRRVYPEIPLRAALRKLGRGAPQALVASSVGRVVFGSAEGVIDVLHAMSRSYALHMRPCSLDVVPHGEHAAIVHLSEVHNFLDSHNIGVFEGVLRHAGVTGRVRMRPYSRTAADLFCEWQPAR